MAAATVVSEVPLALDPAFVAAFRKGTLTPELASAQVGKVVPADADQTGFVFLLLRLCVTVSTPAGGPNKPSGAFAPYEKPNVPEGKRKKKRGARDGHKGSCRPAPTRIDHFVDHEICACPDCAGELLEREPKKLVVEDIPSGMRAEATEHTIRRGWCAKCRKQVEAKVPDVLPNCRIGNRAAVLSAWLHYGLGTTTRQIVEVFNCHLQLKITDGGLTQIWHRLAGILEPWYEQIHAHCLDAGVLHADETGWRLGGDLAWLWCFTRDDATFYMIHEKRSWEAAKLFFTGAFEGILVTDFWRVYEQVECIKQKCWPHLLRELKEIDEGTENGGDWPEFSKKLWRLYGDAVRLAARIDGSDPLEYGGREARLHLRMTELALAAWEHPHARRLAKRLKEFGEDLLTFVAFAEVPSSNNAGERAARPAVLMRKVSQGNATVKGARTRSILMSICRTLKQRGLDPLDATPKALETYCLTGKLPPLPEKIAAGG